MVIGLAGWAALPAIKIETDPAQLVPANDAALTKAEAVRKEVGLTGEIDLLVQGTDPAAPEAVKWLDQASRQAAAQGAASAAGPPTVTLAVPLTPPLEAAIVIGPPGVDPAVNSPDWVIEPLLADQLNAGCGLIDRPNWSSARAVNCWVPPG